MKRCIIYTAYIKGNALDAYVPLADDFVLCADGGYTHALAANVKPDFVIGDGDSLFVDVPPELMLRVPAEKDDTDTMLCVRRAIEEGCTECIILGGIGGRLDHTLANIQTLAFAHEHGLSAKLCGPFDIVMLLGPGKLILDKRDGFSISLFCYTERCEGVFIEGVKYPLSNAALTQAFPLGVSNAFFAPQARISLRSGLLLVVLSQLEGAGKRQKQNI